MDFSLDLFFPRLIKFGVINFIEFVLCSPGIDAHGYPQSIFFGRIDVALRHVMHFYDKRVIYDINIGDPHAEMNRSAGSLEGLLDLAAKDEAEGLGDAPWPPHFRKMEGEAPRDCTYAQLEVVPPQELMAIFSSGR